MTKPVTKADTLITQDGVPIEAVHLPGDRETGFAVAHGFTQNWQRPHVWRVARRLSQHGGVVVFDFRGHGRSGGATTLGDKEIYDLDAAVAHMRELGYRRVVTVGFSMGASIVLRHAGLLGGADAVVSVSGPGRWYYRGTRSMRRVHWVIEHKVGRMLAKRLINTRISQGRWDPVPVPPAEAAARIAPTPVLIVHGDSDDYFPCDHAEQIFEAAKQPKELWIIPGLGHAESAIGEAVLDRIAAWGIAAAAGRLALLARAGLTADTDVEVEAEADSGAGADAVAGR